MPRLPRLRLVIGQAATLPFGTVAERDIETAVELAYDRRATQLWSYARRLGVDGSTAEQLVQEAFARLLQVTKRGARPENIDAWLFRVVHNLAIDEHRRSRPSPVRLIRTEDETDERLALWEEVDKLPEKQRAAIYLRYRADLDFAGVAFVLGITESGARANVFRALARLRERMTEHE
jgi:RNA polymerase sigma-70 factor (ECF subfamily)